MELAVFYLAGAVALASAVVAVSHKSPVVNVLSLVVTFFCVAVNFALLGAEFLAAAQILIYAGAILVLFLFVIMLLGAPGEGPDVIPRPFQRWGGLVLAALAGIGGVLLALSARPSVATNPAHGSVHAIGRLLINPYLFAFELVSVLLLAALVGAFVLVRRKP